MAKAQNLKLDELWWECRKCGFQSFHIKMLEIPKSYKKWNIKALIECDGCEESFITYFSSFRAK